MPLMFPPIAMTDCGVIATADSSHAANAISDAAAVSGNLIEQNFSPMIEGRRVSKLDPFASMAHQIALVPLSERHLDAYYNWIIDPAYRRTQTEPAPSRRELRDRFRNDFYTPGAKKGRFIMTLRGRPIGWLAYWRVPRMDAFEVGTVIGHPADRGKGIGTAAKRTLIDFLFSTFGVERVQARIVENNLPSIRGILKLGFRFEGTMRASSRYNGRWIDSRIFGLLRDDWLQEERNKGVAPRLFFHDQNSADIRPYNPSLVRLLPLTECYLDHYLHWSREADFVRYDPDGYSSKAVIENRIRNGFYQRPWHRERFVIETREGTPIGWIGFSRERALSALELDLYLSRVQLWNQELCGAALTNLVRRLFACPRVSRLQVRTQSDNENMICLLRSVGFRLEVRMRSGFSLRDQRRDVLLFGLLRRD